MAGLRMDQIRDGNEVVRIGLRKGVDGGVSIMTPGIAILPTFTYEKSINGERGQGRGHIRQRSKETLGYGSGIPLFA